MNLSNRLMKLSQHDTMVICNPKLLFTYTYTEYNIYQIPKPTTKH
jgi:hypothetical protein